MSSSQLIRSAVHKDNMTSLLTAMDGVLFRYSQDFSFVTLFLTVLALLYARQQVVSVTFCLQPLQLRGCTSGTEGAAGC